MATFPFHHHDGGPCAECGPDAASVDIVLPGTSPAGVWILAGRIWGYEGPSWAIPFATEVEALRAMNAGDGERVYFVPFGVDLQAVMNAWPKAVGE